MGLVSIGRVRLAETTYAFIDGEYLRKVYDASMNEFFRNPGEIDFTNTKRMIGAKRVFYYDCLDDIRRDRESQDAFQARLAGQETYFDRMRAIEGFHVRLGTLAGIGRRPRQKEVDVLLAVDMMNHAVNGNMTQAVLVSGDRDFKPVVESLVQLGTYVRVYYERRSAAKELWQAADGSVELTLAQFHTWSSDRFRTRNAIPSATQGVGPPDSGFRAIKQGSHRDRPLTIYEKGGELLLFAQASEDEPSLAVLWKDQEQLERFFEGQFGPIRWD